MVRFLILRNSNFPFTSYFSCFGNITSFFQLLVFEFSSVQLLAWLGRTFCCSPTFPLLMSHLLSSKFTWALREGGKLIARRNLRQYTTLQYTTHIIFVSLQSKSRYDWRAVSVSSCQAHSGTCAQILVSFRMLLSQISCLVSVGLPLWRDVRSVICHSHSIVIYWYLHQTFKLHVFYSSAFNKKYIQSFFQFWLGTADYAQLITISSNYKSSLRHLNGRINDRRQVQAFNIFCVGFRFVEYCVHFHFRDCEWFLLVFCITLLCSHECTEFGKPHAYRGPERTSRDCPWCGENYLAGAAISLDEFLPQIPMRDKKACKALHIRNLLTTHCGKWSKK
jgi:hypothetical protein